MGDRPVSPYEYTSAIAVAGRLVARGGGLKVQSIGIKVSAAPTTSEDLIVKIDSATGASFDQTILTLDAAAVSMTSLFLEGPFFIAEGDALEVNYANTDTRTFGVVVAHTVGDF